MDKLVDILGRVPLAITQAPPVIDWKKIKIPEYVEELAVKKQNLMAYLSKDVQDPRRESGFPNHTGSVSRANSLRYT